VGLDSDTVCRESEQDLSTNPTRDGELPDKDEKASY
jgi:hypothetical protein